MMNKAELRMIGNRIGDERRKQGLTQTELSLETDLTLKTISMIETGQREPKISSLMALCRCLNVTVDYILYGDAPDADSVLIKNLMNGLGQEVSQPIKDLLVGIRKLMD